MPGLAPCEVGSKGGERRLKVAVTKCECRDRKVEEEGEGLVQKCPTRAPRPRTLKNSKENICTDERWDKLYEAQRIRLEINYQKNTWKGWHWPIKNGIHFNSHLKAAPNKCSFIHISIFYAFRTCPNPLLLPHVLLAFSLKPILNPWQVQGFGVFFSHTCKIENHLQWGWLLKWGRNESLVSIFDLLNVCA